MVNLDKIIKKIKNKELQKYFQENINFHYHDSISVDEFLKKFEKDLKEIFSNTYDFLKYNLKNHSYYSSKYLLTEALLLEYQEINYKNLESILVYKDVFNSPTPITINWHFFARGIKEGYFNTKDVIKFIDNNVDYYTYLFPLITNYGSQEDFEYLSSLLKNAKLEDSMRILIFKNALVNCVNKDCVLFFINLIKENNYYRLIALKEAFVYYYEDSALDIKVNLRITEDAANFNYTPYINKGFRENFYFLIKLKVLSKDNYNLYLGMVLKGDNKLAKLAGIYSLRYYFNGEFHNICFEDYIDLINEIELDYQDVSMFGNIDVDKFTVDQAKLLFEKLYYLFNYMNKVNYHFYKNDDLFIATDINKCNIVRELSELSLLIDNNEYYNKMDLIVDKMDVESSAVFIERLSNKTQINKRELIISFLKSDNYSGLKAYNNANINLTFDEAVKVSDYLKSKKETVKKNIIGALYQSDFNKQIAEYLVSSNIDYKKSIGEELQEKLGMKKKQTTYLTELVFPDEEINNILSNYKNKYTIELVNLDKVKKFFEQFNDFIEENKNYEFKSTLEYSYTFGSNFFPLNRKDDRNYVIEDYPLGFEIKEKFLNILSSKELVNLSVELRTIDKNGKTYLEFFPKEMKRFEYLKTLYNTYLLRVVNDVLLAFIVEFADKKEVLELYINLMKNHSNSEAFSNDRRYGTSDFDLFVRTSYFVEDNECLMLWRYIYAYSLKNNLSSNPSIYVISKLVEKELISYDFLRYFTLKRFSYLSGMVTRNDNSYYLKNNKDKNLKFKNVMLKLISEAVDAELNRGSEDTVYTQFIRSCDEFYGVNTYLRALVAIRNLTLVRTNFFYETGKNAMISQILSMCVKDSNDSYDEFVNFIKDNKITKKELIKACVYNPSFIDYIEKYLNILGFKLSVYYFMAHLNEKLDENKIEIFKKYSNIDYHDFKDGAFDINWYNEMINTIPTDDLKIIYDNAKYITVAGLHKRAQRFFDAKNNNITLEECILKIKETRNKDYVLIYSLIPIKSEDDLYERYLFIQDYLKESKKFGSQRQLSERRVVDIAMDNLARNANYADVSLFTYEMEAKNGIDSLDAIEVDDIKLVPLINHLRISIEVYKGDKKLSSIPSIYNKKEEVIAFKENIKLAQNKLKRLVRSFEETMCNHIAIDYAKLMLISKDFIIKNVLSKLILLSDENVPLLLKDNRLETLNGKEMAPNKVYIAHPIELKKYDLLQGCMNYIIRNNIKQPFKQVLREFYTKSDEELTKEDVWRFRGFNVDLKKCIAALKGHGWGISDDVGLRKVYYHQNTVAILFREFDDFYTYDFTDVNRELHTITFINRKTEEVIQLKDVDEITFSECLRDVDLMISISSNAIYDIELAMSTTQMRQEILKSLIDILGLPNVTFLKDNIKVEGHYGGYTINIRTGLVFMDGKGNLLLKTIYSNKQPLLLDFVDEDPMTADIISKAIYLANDINIKDPTILVQIQKN